MHQPPFVSVVAPCFDEEEGLPEFYRRAAAACTASAGDSWEIVLVDDGSRDGTWRVIEQLAKADRRVVGIRLMRNHGHQLAASSGLAAATGECVLLIDADLQDPPELLEDMLGVLNKGADVVYGKREARDGETWFKRASAAAFYRLLSRLTSVAIPEDTGDFRLMRRRIVDMLVAMPENHRFLRGMVSWIGGRQVAFPYRREARHAGVTKYPLARMMRLAADAITAFSVSPLRLASWAGVFVAALGMLLLIYTFVRWIQGDIVAGWASTMTAITFFASIQLIVLGVIGEYLGRLVQEAKDRPLFLVDVVRKGVRDMELPVEFSRLPARERRTIMRGLGADLLVIEPGPAIDIVERADPVAVDSRPPVKGARQAA